MFNGKKYYFPTLPQISIYLFKLQTIKPGKLTVAKILQPSFQIRALSRYQPLYQEKALSNQAIQPQLSVRILELQSNGQQISKLGSISCDQLQLKKDRQAKLKDFFSHQLDKYIGIANISLLEAITTWYSILEYQRYLSCNLILSPSCNLILSPSLSNRQKQLEARTNFNRTLEQFLKKKIIPKGLEKYFASLILCSFTILHLKTKIKLTDF